VKPKAAEVKKIQTAIRKIDRKTFDPDELVDHTRERLLRVVEKKRKEGEDVVETEESEAPPGDIIDLMEVLKRSLSGKESSRPKKSGSKNKASAKKNSAKKSSAKKSTAKKASARKTSRKKSARKSA
jgi:non-homologous end joining protein Ku